MTFSLIRFEICHTTRRLAYLPPSEGSFKAATQVRPLAEKEEIVRSLQKRLETTYLVHCQGAGPLFWVAAMIARLIMAKMYLIIYTPHIEAGLSQETKDRLFVVSIEIVEYCKLIKTEVSTKQWGWVNPSNQIILADADSSIAFPHLLSMACHCFYSWRDLLQTSISTRRPWLESS